MSQSREAFIIDIEADNLYPYYKNVWVIVVKKMSTGERLIIHPFRGGVDVKQLIMDFISPYEKPIIAFHNGLGYDIWVLWKEYGMKVSVGPDKFCGFDVEFFDTYQASQFLLPDRPDGHSLRSWGIRQGDHKIEYREVCIEKGYIPKNAPDGEEFKQWTPEMDIYCEKDCDVCEKTLIDLYYQIIEEKSMFAFRLSQKTMFLMSAQEFTGFKFDIEKAKELVPRIQTMIQDLRNEVEPNLPSRPLKKGEEKYYSVPAKPYLKTGEFSKTMENWLEKHEATAITNTKIIIYGTEITIYPNMLLNVKKPMELSDNNALKDWFLEIGWQPTMWNFKKDKKGKAIRDEKRQLIFTSPKIQENGRICPNLLELNGELPQKVVRFLSLRNRLSVLTGWLENPRLEWDGRLPAKSSGIASTHRQKHQVVANIPKAQDDVLLGKEFRSLFTVDEGNMLIGCDQAALEARCEGHWTYKYDDGESARELIDGDCHSVNAKAFYPKETESFDIKSLEFNKDDPKFKPYRSKSKNGKYAITYGAAPPKVAATLGLPEQKGKELFEAFWKANPALKLLKDNIEKCWKQNQGVWIPGIDGRRLHSRSQHSLVNLLFQSTGAIIVDYALCLFDQIMGGLELDNMGRPYYFYKEQVIKRVQYYHDEFGIEAPEAISPHIAEISEWCMAEAGVRLKLKVPLIGEAKIGRNWMETH